MPRNYLIVPILLCLAVALWQHQCCQAAKTHRVSAERLDWIEPPEGMEWLSESETENEAVEEQEQKTRIRQNPIRRQQIGRRTTVQRRGAKVSREISCWELWKSSANPAGDRTIREIIE
jgi:hypothetical protein